jgi:hypothetical protein
VEEVWPHEWLEPPPAVAGALPPIGDWPLLWKETLTGREESVARRFERSLRRGWPVLAIAIALSAAVIGLLRTDSLPDPEELRRKLGIVFRLLVMATAGVWCAVLAFRAAAGVSLERDKGTLEGLLTLPVSRAELLAAKWAGPIVYSRVLGYLLAAVAVVGLLSGVLHPVGAVLVLMAVAAHAAFLASLGVWLSLASRNTLWARVTMAMVLLVFLGIALRVMLPDARAGNRPAAAGAAAVPPWGPRRPAPRQKKPVNHLVLPKNAPPLRAPQPWASLPWGEYVGQTGANAPGSWWFLAFSRDDYAAALEAADSHFVGRLAVAECGILAYAVAARLLWALACLRFRGEQRR